jgi:hypothetical protein
VVISPRRISSSAKSGLQKVLVGVYMFKELLYRMVLVCPSPSFRTGLMSSWYRWTTRSE